MVEKDYFDDETGMPKAAADEARELGVDARLDNRMGTDRPRLVKDPAVPQQVDGPDLMHQEEHAQAVAAIARSQGVGDRVGMFSPGDHSLGDVEARGGNDAGQADSLLETDPASKASAPTDARSGEPDALGGGGPAVSATETATAGPGERRTRSAPQVRDAAAKSADAKDAKSGEAKDAAAKSGKDAEKKGDS